MADPTPYERSYSFTDFQAGNPSAPLPGIQVDNELENVEQSLEQVVNAIKDVRRSDGKLKNGIVTVDSLDPTVAAGVGSGALASAAAAAASAGAAADSAEAAAASAGSAAGYSNTAATSAGQAMTFRNEAEAQKTLAQTARTGAQTARDFAAQWSSAPEGQDVNDGVNPVNKSAYHWAQVALGAATGALPDGSVSTSKIVDGAVTSAKIANASIGDDQVDEIGSLKLEHTQPQIGGVSRSVAQILNEWLTPQRFGAEGDDSTECGPAFIAAKNALLEHGGTLTVPPGRYRTSVNLDLTTGYSSYAPEGRISIEGAGANVCQIVYTGVASPTSFLLDMGDDGTGESYNVRSYMRVFGLGLTPLVPNSIGGLCLRRQAYFEIDHLHCFGLSEGLRLESSLTGKVDNSWLQGNRTGAYLLKGARSGAFSSPNALLFSNVVVGENSENGIYADNPGPLTILGGTFEGNLNALTVLRNATMAGLGPVALNILGATYFEHNSGEADVKISQEGSVAGGIGQYNIIANFNRISSSVKTTNNIKIVHNSGILQANIQSAFAEAGTYTASGSELYLAVSGSAASANRRVLDTGSTYQSAVARPTIEAMQNYEGGTFVPVISGVTTSGATGWFEKRGRFVSGELSFTCTGAAGGPLAATLPGLPVPDIFASASGMEVNTTAKAVVGFINAAASSIQGVRFADGSTAFANGHVVRVAFRYRCAG